MARPKRAQRPPTGHQTGRSKNPRARIKPPSQTYNVSFVILPANDEAIELWAAARRRGIRSHAMNDMIAETAARHGLPHAVWPTEAATFEDAADASEEPAA